MFRRQFFRLAKSAGDKGPKKWRRTTSFSAASHFEGTSYRSSTGETIPSIEQQISRGEAKQKSALMNMFDDTALRMRDKLMSDSVEGENNKVARKPSRFDNSTIVQWGRLIRLDRPAGTFLLVLPCFWGTAMAVTKAVIAEGADPVVLCAPFIPMHLIGLFLFGAWTMRSAGCIINDMWDRELDKKVDRCKDRPLASGKVTMGQATAMLGVHLGLGASLCLGLHPLAVGTAFASIPLVILYPAMKRVTYAPQVILGMAMNWGVFVGYAAVLGRIDLAVCVPLWLAGVAWTIIYDTIYAYQDFKDDEKAGVKSLTQIFGHSKTPFYALMLPVFAGLGLSGLAAGQSFPYYVSMTFIMFQLWAIVDHFNPNDPRSCLRAFKVNVRFGFYMFCCMCIGNFFWVLYSVWVGLQPTNTTNTATWTMTKILSMNVCPADQPYASLYEFRWIDRLLKPAFVQVHAAKREGNEDPVIPPYMRREYIGQNVASLIRLTGQIPEETIQSWEHWWYRTSDHYTYFGNL